MLNEPTLLQFRIPVSPSLLFSLFALVIAGWLIFSIVLRYHWGKYSVNKLELIGLHLIYFVGSGILLCAIGISAVLYATL